MVFSEFTGFSSRGKYKESLAKQTPVGLLMEDNKMKAQAGQRQIKSPVALAQYKVAEG